MEKKKIRPWIFKTHKVTEKLQKHVCDSPRNRPSKFTKMLKDFACGGQRETTK